MAHKIIEEKLDAIEQEAINVKSSVDKLSGIEEGVAALLKSVSALSTEIAIIMSQTGISEIINGSSSKKGKESISNGRVDDRTSRRQSNRGSSRWQQV